MCQGPPCLGRALDSRGSEVPSGSESQLPLIQFIKHGQYPTSRQHLNSATQVSCSELWTVGGSVRLENEPSSACKRSSWLSGGTHQWGPARGEQTARQALLFQGQLAES